MSQQGWGICMWDEVRVQSLVSSSSECWVYCSALCPVPQSEKVQYRCGSALSIGCFYLPPTQSMTDYLFSIEELGSRVVGMPKIIVKELRFEDHLQFNLM